MRATKAIIHLDCLKANIESIRRKIGPRVRICVPIKADAYGHGATRVAVAAIRAGAACLAVASVQEGIELRESGIVAPILLLSLPLLEELPAVVEHHLTLMVSDADIAEALDIEAQRQCEIADVHIKIDTGMGRIGCNPCEAAELATFISTCDSLRYTGTASHFSAADSVNPDDIAYTKHQISIFKDAVEKIKAAGIDPGIIHIANSGAVILHEDSYFDMVRPGLLIYGYPPIESMANTVPVKPVMEIVTNIVFTKQVKKGDYVSYGRTWQAREDTVLATLPIGYADGLPRALSSHFSVCINGTRYPLVGRICMDQCMVDLGLNPPVSRWDQVTVFGGEDASFDAADIAKKLETIPYEITCNINKRVPRVYLG
ncbi:MAG: alanine racemase [Treponema sp.]|jgi:alanine racemase|nr:alanine racemase [Treponema sp.]